MNSNDISHKKRKDSMRMQKKQFRIGELAKRLNVERFVIRFWEKEFNLKPHRSHGGQRFYEERDFNKFCKIKELLYERGFTISGARQQLDTNEILGSCKTTIEETETTTSLTHTIDINRFMQLKKKLLKLRKGL